MKKLDIIVMHYLEPWEIGEKFFKMLDLQRGINFDDIRVILIHDGVEPFPEDYFSARPYEVKQIWIAHGGLAAARNAGIREANAERISFSDFDDMYHNVCGLLSVMETFSKAEKLDMLVADFVEEDECPDGKIVYRMRGRQDMVFVHGKYFRLDVIRQHNITFDPSLPYNEDGLFNAVVYSYIGPERIGFLETQYPPYLWCYRQGSMTKTPGTRWKMLIGMYLRDRKTADAYEIRRPWKEYVGAAARVIVDAYYMMNYRDVETYERFDEIYGNIRSCWPKYRPLLEEVSTEELQSIRKVSEEIHCTETFLPVDPAHPDDYRILEKRPSFWDWVDETDRRFAEEAKANDPDIA